MKSRSRKSATTKKKPASPRAGKRPVLRAEKPTPAPAADLEFDESIAVDPCAAVTTASTSAQAETEVAAPSSSPQRAGLKLESTFTLRDANDMLFQLLAVDFGDAEVLVDGGGVERIDTAGLQMLIAFARHHAARGKTLNWTAVSPELLRSSQLLGVTEPLHLTAYLNQGDAGGH